MRVLRKKWVLAALTRAETFTLKKAAFFGLLSLHKYNCLLSISTEPLRRKEGSDKKGEFVKKDLELGRFIQLLQIR